jgi:hypothetical protein
MEEQMPKAARQYVEIVRERQDNAFLRQRFHQVTWLAVPNAEYGDAEFFVLEFRSDRNSALAWLTTQNKWATGGWLPLAHPGADVTCAPTPLKLGYLASAKTYATLDAALAHLAESMPEPLSLWQSLSRLARKLRRH